MVCIREMGKVGMDPHFIFMRTWPGQDWLFSKLSLHHNWRICSVGEKRTSRCNCIFKDTNSNSTFQWISSFIIRNCGCKASWFAAGSISVSTFLPNSLAFQHSILGLGPQGEESMLDHLLEPVSMLAQALMEALRLTRRPMDADSSDSVWLMPPPPSSFLFRLLYDTHVVSWPSARA